MSRLAPFRSLVFTLFLLGLDTPSAQDLRQYAGAYKPASQSLKDLKGKAHSVSDLQGNVVLVNFWASWCGPCIAEIPSLRTLQERMAGKPLKILAINVEEGPFKIHKFSQLVEMPFTVLLDEDGSVFDAWGGVVLPTSFLIDPEGRIRYRVQGPLDWASEEAVETVRGLLRGTGAPRGPAEDAPEPTSHSRGE